MVEQNSISRAGPPIILTPLLRLLSFCPHYPALPLLCLCTFVVRTRSERAEADARRRGPIATERKSNTSAASKPKLDVEGSGIQKMPSRRNDGIPFNRAGSGGRPGGWFMLAPTAF